MKKVSRKVWIWVLAGVAAIIGMVSAVVVMLRPRPVLYGPPEVLYGPPSWYEDDSSANGRHEKIAPQLKELENE